MSDPDPSSALLALYAEAKQLVGREVEVETVATPYGPKSIVVWMSFSNKAPPTGDGEMEALEKFIAWYKTDVLPSLKALPDVEAST